MASRRVLGFALGEHHDAQLAYSALAMAVAVRGGQVPGVIMHTDQRQRIHRRPVPAGLPSGCPSRQWMGRPGSALDNAVIESWHSTLEFELRSVEHFDHPGTAKARVTTWIHDYNRNPRHSALARTSPVSLRAGTTAKGDLMPPLPRHPRCPGAAPMSRSFLPGHGLRSGVIWQLSRSTDRPDQPNRSVHAFRGTPQAPAAQRCRTASSVAPLLRCNCFAFGALSGRAYRHSPNQDRRREIGRRQAGSCASEYGGVTRILVWCPATVTHEVSTERFASVARTEGSALDGTSPCG